MLNITQKHFRFIFIGVSLTSMSALTFAQNSATLYGVADAGIGISKIDGDRHVHFVGAGRTLNGGSRIGVRGIEDLGQGLKVGYNIETGINLATGAGASGSGNGQFWGRASNIWIASNWGTIQMGRGLNPSFFAAYAWELTGAANYSVVGYSYGAAGSPISRYSGMLMYTTPSISGLQGRIAYADKHSNEPGESQISAGITYRDGPISIGFGAAKEHGEKTNYQLGARYTFGSLTLAGSYSHTNAAHDTFINDGSKRTGFSLGGIYQITPTTSFLVDMTHDTTNKWTNNPSQRKYTNAVLEIKHSLSKRTFIYADLLHVDKTTNYGAGIRHNF